MLYGSWYYPIFLIGVLWVYWRVTQAPETRLKLLVLASAGFLLSVSWQGVLAASGLGLMTFYAAGRLRRKQTFALLASGVSVLLGILALFKLSQAMPRGSEYAFL